MAQGSEGQALATKPDDPKSELNPQDPHGVMEGENWPLHTHCGSHGCDAQTCKHTKCIFFFKHHIVPRGTNLPRALGCLTPYIDKFNLTLLSQLTSTRESVFKYSPSRNKAR